MCYTLYETLMILCTYVCFAHSHSVFLSCDQFCSMLLRISNLCSDYVHSVFLSLLNLTQISPAPLRSVRSVLIMFAQFCSVLLLLTLDTCVIILCGPGRAMIRMSGCSVVRSVCSVLVLSSGGDHCCPVEPVSALEGLYIPRFLNIVWKRIPTVHCSLAEELGSLVMH